MAVHVRQLLAEPNSTYYHYSKLTKTPTQATLTKPRVPLMSDQPCESKTDIELVALAQQGDTEAFDDLIIKYSPKLYGLIYHMTSNRDDTNDLLQDVFAKAFRSITRFKGKSSFYTWIYAIATNTTLNFLKKRNRRKGLSLDDLDSSIHRDSEFIELTSKSDPVHETYLGELQVRLNEAMQTLSDNHRAVVTMYDIQGIAHTEIAKILKVSEGTIRSRLFYAHRQLQTQLGDLWNQNKNS